MPEITIEELEAMIATGRSLEEQKAARLALVREEIRGSLEVLNRVPDHYRIIPPENVLPLPEFLHGDQFVITLRVREQELLAECTAYGLSNDDCRGLTVRTGTQELVFQDRGEERLNYAWAYLPDWDGTRGPVRFELRDID